MTLKIKPDDLTGLIKKAEYKLKNIGILKEYSIDEKNLSTYDIFGQKILLGQIHLRLLLNINYGIKENPWCILANDQFGHLSIISILYWNLYSYIPKTVFFLNDKIIAIKMLNNFVEKNYCRQKRINNIIDRDDFKLWCKPYWTIDNIAYNRIPLSYTINRLLVNIEFDPETNIIYNKNVK